VTFTEAIIDENEGEPGTVILGSRMDRLVFEIQNVLRTDPDALLELLDDLI
jgi:hypothetical protein